MILCERPPAIPKTTFSAENEMELKVEESLMMPAVFHTVASRTQLAVVSKFVVHLHTKGQKPFYVREVTWCKFSSDFVRRQWKWCTINDLFLEAFVPDFQGRY